MTQNTKMQKTQTRVFVQNCKIKRNGNICVLCHNFWSNQNVQLLSTSKWPQFCERWRYLRQKNGQKRSYNGYLRVTFVRSLFTYFLGQNVPKDSHSERRRCIWKDLTTFASQEYSWKQDPCFSTAISAAQRYLQSLLWYQEFLPIG